MAKMNVINTVIENNDLLENILGRLDASSFAYATCVNQSWNNTCRRILSRPKLASALSLNYIFEDAMQEVFDKVLAQPIRPHFAIASVSPATRLRSTRFRIKQKFGPRIPFVVTYNAGIIGRDASSEELVELKWEENSDGQLTNHGFGILLTIGYLPGLKVNVIPFQELKGPWKGLPVDVFVRKISDYAMDVSGSSSPAGIIIFGHEDVDQKVIAQKLDYAMSSETFIVGEERSKFMYRSLNESEYVLGSQAQAVAIVFARDRYKPHDIGDIEFHFALSKGLSTIGPKYKAASVRVNNATWLTARREENQEILDGQQILNNINEELENRIGSPDLYIGVTKRRKCSIGTSKGDYITSLEYHGVAGGDEQYLYVEGGGIRTGDWFRFYHSDPSAALHSLRKVSDNLKTLSNDDKKEAFGGFVFACCGRGKSFFGGDDNHESAPFIKNFPEVPLAGVFCGGEVGRISFEEENTTGKISLHVYSSVYLVMSYTPPPFLEH
ncbi:hypothetical protein ACFE04_006736 [Oxalis oulophora]